MSSNGNIIISFISYIYVWDYIVKDHHFILGIWFVVYYLVYGCIFTAIIFNILFIWIIWAIYMEYIELSVGIMSVLRVLFLCKNFQCCFEFNSYAKFQTVTLFSDINKIKYIIVLSIVKCEYLSYVIWYYAIFNKNWNYCNYFKEGYNIISPSCIETVLKILATYVEIWYFVNQRVLR